MNCINCKSEWTTPLGITVTECPFCKKSIEPTKIPKTYLTAKDALCFIMQTYGAEALLTKSLLSDIAPNLSDERELIKIFREKGALDILNSALKSSTAEQSIAIKRAIGKLPSYLRDSTVAISLMNDFATALGWNVPSLSIAKSVPPQMVNIVPMAQPNLGINSQSTRIIGITPKIGSIIAFGKYDWRVLDVQNGQVLLLCDKVIEKKRYHSSDTATTWAECELRGYLNNTFYNSFGQEKSQIGESRNNNPNNLWYNTNGGKETTDRIFLLSLEESDKYFGNSGDYSNKRRQQWDSKKSYPAEDGSLMSNNYDQLRIAKDSSEAACMWWLRSPGSISSHAACVNSGGGVSVSWPPVSSTSGGVRPALWLNL